jgi:tRNA dimethylallyltransferase
MLSEFFDTEIISADSRQIFRYMNIGTDKVSQEIRDRIPHHQIDIVDPDQRYTAGQWQKDVYRIIEEIQSRGKLPMIVGGTGLYIDTIYKNFTLPDAKPNPSLREELYAKEEANPGYLHATLSQLDPEEAQKLHPNSTRYLVRALEIFYTTGETKTASFIQQAVKYPLLMLGLRREKDAGNMMINARIKDMFAQGLVAEVQDLLDRRYTEDLQSMQGIGYKEVIPLIRGECTQEKSEEQLRKNTHHLAKKQRTRFRRYIAEGKQSPKDNVEYEVFYF